jgi:hypothetical protein
MQDRALKEIHRELLLAFESARTRLAVSIAAETKSTPLDRWRYYLETADRMCRFMKKMRKQGFHAVRKPEDWVCALETLRHLPVQDRALRLCQLLGDIVTGLE